MAKPWMNRYILKLISHRDSLFKRKKENPLNNKIRCCYNLFRNRVTREIKKAKREYYRTFFEENLNDMKQTWKGIKEIININNKTQTQISQLVYQGKPLNDNKDMANAFNEFFTNVGTDLDKEIPKANIKKDSTTYLKSRIENDFLTQPTTP